MQNRKIWHIGTHHSWWIVNISKDMNDDFQANDQKWGYRSQGKAQKWLQGYSALFPS